MAAAMLRENDKTSVNVTLLHVRIVTLSLDIFGKTEQIGCINWENFLEV